MNAPNAPQDRVAGGGQPLGHVHSVTGSQASIGILDLAALKRSGATVGKFVKIHTGKTLLIGLITELSASPGVGDQGSCGTAHVDLTGEISDRSGAVSFRRGVGEYPTVGDPVTTLTSNELRVVFDTSSTKTIKVGRVSFQPKLDFFNMLNVSPVISVRGQNFGTSVSKMVILKGEVLPRGDIFGDA